ncbi:MAG: carboxyltransferase domain-containing protein, partial [Burkholderiales bacterium]|nr:carboxyltransferase domain-containing protein [Burkholderiales bacterium]
MTAPIDDLRCAPLGDRALVVEFHRAPKGELADRVRAAAEHLLARPIPGVTDVVYAHGSVTVHFDPLLVAVQERSAQPMQVMQQAVLTALARAPRLP